MNVDVLVIGGGINGVGIATDAAGRGLSVILCEKDDLASHTSSASTKLIHGGLRYLEQIEFKLVHEALREREILLKRAPHLVHPLKFVLPYDAHYRPAWIIRLGLKFYDCLVRHSAFKRSQGMNLERETEGKPLKSAFNRGFSYYDSRTDDARLVVTNAIEAKNKGAVILTRTECVSAQRDTHYWSVRLKDQKTDQIKTIYAKAIVNAAGTFVSCVLQSVFNQPLDSRIHLIKGSHIVIPKLYQGDWAYLLQNRDKRVVFAIPFQGEFTLIGTTDVPYKGDLDNVQITDDEIRYLIRVTHHYFKNPIQQSDIYWSYAGVRALYDSRKNEAQKITREYHLEINDLKGELPLISIFGGKLTTYRSLAETVLKQLNAYFPDMKKPWTSKAPLPGGDFEEKTFESFFENLTQQYAWVHKPLLYRYAENYGTQIHCILMGTKTLSNLGQHFGAGLYEREVVYLKEHEWAVTAEDILWRRSKLGLFLDECEVNQLKSELPRL